MKKYLAILLAVVMVLGAVACTKTPAAETPATEQPAAEAPATEPAAKARPTSNWLPTMRLSRATPTVFVTRLTSRKLLLLPQTTV